MKEEEKKFLIDKYNTMPEKELLEMVITDKNDYKEGIYDLVLNAAKSRNLPTEKNKAKEMFENINKEETQLKRTSALLSTKKIIFGFITFISGAIILAILKQINFQLSFVGGFLFMFGFLTLFFKAIGKTSQKNKNYQNNIKQINIKTDKSKFCSKCGKGYDNSWKFCLHCSIPLSNSG